VRAGDVVAGRYRLIERLGVGSMGEVWRATDTELGRDVALKRALDATSADDAERLRREARAAAGVHHPNVVTLFDVVEHGGQRWLVMEFVPARSLADLVAADGPLPPVEVAALGASLASALAAVHAAGVVHRDVKPGNVLVRSDGQPKLGDFGISRSWSDETLASSAMVVGTPAYLAPEVAAGGPPTQPADVFGLGATLITALTGETPYGEADNAWATLRRAAAGPPLAVPPGPVGAALARVVAIAPADRPTATEAGALLAAAAAQRPARAPWWTSRRVAVLVTLLLIAGLFTVLAVVAGDDPAPADAVPTPAARALPTPKPKRVAPTPVRTAPPAALATTKTAGTKKHKQPTPTPTAMTQAEYAAEGARCAQLAQTDPIAGAACAQKLQSASPRP
jgi:serine/threonine protein kinase